MARQMGNRFCKEDKPLGVIRVIHTVRAVKLCSVIKPWDIHEIERQVFLRIQSLDSAANRFRPQRQFQQEVERLKLGKALPYSCIERCDESHLMTLARQRFR